MGAGHNYLAYKKGSNGIFRLAVPRPPQAEAPKPGTTKPINTPSPVPVSSPSVSPPLPPSGPSSAKANPALNPPKVINLPVDPKLNPPTSTTTTVAPGTKPISFYQKVKRMLSNATGKISGGFNALRSAYLNSYLKNKEVQIAVGSFLQGPTGRHPERDMNDYLQARRVKNLLEEGRTIDDPNKKTGAPPTPPNKQPQNGQLPQRQKKTP